LFQYIISTSTLAAVVQITKLKHWRCKGACDIAMFHVVVMIGGKTVEIDLFEEDKQLSMVDARLQPPRSGSVLLLPPLPPTPVLPPSNHINPVRSANSRDIHSLNIGDSVFGLGSCTEETNSSSGNSDLLHPHQQEQLDTSLEQYGDYMFSLSLSVASPHRSFSPAASSCSQQDLPLNARSQVSLHVFRPVKSSLLSFFSFFLLAAVLPFLQVLTTVKHPQEADKML
jgi:hypothetical protein